VTKLTSETLRRMYVDEQQTVIQIARALRVRTQTVCDALKVAGIPRRPCGRRLPALSSIDVQTQRLIQTAVRREGIDRTAQTLALPRDMLHAILGETPQMRSQLRAVSDDGAVWASRQQGATVADLAAQYQCSERAIYRSLRRATLALQR
jgi:hypothetical protein